jgi:hypothetical protein
MFTSKKPQGNQMQKTEARTAGYRQVQNFKATTAMELKELEMGRLRGLALRFAVMTQLEDEQWEHIFTLSQKGIDLNSVFDAVAQELFRGAHAR